MNATGSRLPDGGRIDRSAQFTITVDGTEYAAHPGDTVASAMLAGGEIRVGDSIYKGRPRGIYTAGVEEPNALLQLSYPRIEPMVPATTCVAVDGLTARTLSGFGVLDPSPDDAVYDKKFVHTDVLVIGGGPAGLAAALTAAGSGARVIIMDDRCELGGSLLSGRSERIDGVAGVTWVEQCVEALAQLPEVTILPATMAFGSYDSNYVVAVQTRTQEHTAQPNQTRQGLSHQRVWHVRAGEVIVATGAHERPLIFANNDTPGVMLASAVRSYLNRYAVLCAERVVVATTGDSAYDTAADLLDSGASVIAVIDARTELSARARALSERGVRVLTGSFVHEAEPDPATGRVRRVRTGNDAFDCDLLAVSGGWSPAVHLHSQRSGSTRWDSTLAAFVPEGDVPQQQIVGGAAGAHDLVTALQHGSTAGARASGQCGHPTQTIEFVAEQAPIGAENAAVWLPEDADGDPGEWTTHFVDIGRDQSVADIWRAAGAGMRSVEHIKRYTSIGTGHDQGKTSGVGAVGVIAAAVATTVSALGTTTYRAPYAPVSFAALAGRERGDLFDPRRTTPIHPWHQSHGAAYEIVGQWLRPRYYPRDGEGMHEAVARECRAARTGAAMMDASTLGKIEIQGPDAGEFLNRMYTNAFAKLPVGSARYGVMCTADGMMFDDGVAMRLAEDRYLITTTTGGAAGVLDWLEEWLQTEWPELKVYCTSVTEQWSTIAVVGPRSREVLERVAPELDCSNEAFGFMTFRETTLASGIAARICRISFSGELAFEINVRGLDGLATWEQVYAAGADLDITPYGTETMHVLRAEKGYPIIGQDTDGTVTPHDAGMSWIVSTKKDFVGKRSYSRPDTARADRKQLVGLLPVDRSTVLPEGTQLVDTDVDTRLLGDGEAPVPMLGFVTSSYPSVTLERPFALALITRGRERIGQQLQAVVGETLIAVEVAPTVLYDPEGTRRDG